jgi:hypothetical protein
MKLYLVKEAGEPLWVVALAHETMYAYVANTGKFHDNDALRNDYYMERDFSYEEIGPAEARRLIDDGARTAGRSRRGRGPRRLASRPQTARPRRRPLHRRRLPPLMTVGRPGAGLVVELGYYGFDGGFGDG